MFNKTLKTFTLTTAIFLLCFVGVTNAQEDATSTATTSVQEEPVTQEMTESVVAPPTNSTAAVLGVRAQERITNLAANISNRFDAVIARLQNISDRLETRLEKLQSEGQANEAALSSLNNAKADLETARLNMSKIDEQVMQAVGSTDPLLEWQTVRSNYSDTKVIILGAHAKIRETIGSIKNPLPADSATTSSETNINQ
jgi:exonuclease VII small subunit